MKAVAFFLPAFLPFRLALAAAFFAFSSVPALAEILTIPGSGNPEYVLGELAKAFNASQQEHRVVLPVSTGHAGAVRDVSEGVTPLGRVGRPLNSEEKAKGLSYLPLGRDAVVIVAGAEVTAKGISSEQLADVFAGKITDWQQMGGARGPIRAVSKENSDALRRQLPSRYRDFIYADSVKIVHLDPYLLELLDRYPTSFSMMNRSALAACKTKIVVLALDGVEPSFDNLASGRYPLSMEFGLIFRTGDLSPAGKAFINFIHAAEGSRILRLHGILTKGDNR